MKIGEKILKNGGLKLYMENNQSIFGNIRLEDKLYEIRFWYKNIFQNTYHENTLIDAKTKLKELIINAYQHEKIDEKKLNNMENFNIFNESKNEKKNINIKNIINTGEIYEKTFFAFLKDQNIWYIQNEKSPELIRLYNDDFLYLKETNWGRFISLI